MPCLNRCRGGSIVYRKSVTGLKRTGFSVTVNAVWMLALIGIGVVGVWLGTASADTDEVPLWMSEEVQSIRIEVDLPQLNALAVTHEGIDVINEAIRRTAFKLVWDLVEMGSVSGTYETNLYDGELYSMTINVSGYRPPMAHPMHLRGSVTGNLKTGRIYGLSDLFVDETYIDVISRFVKDEIERQELPIFEPFDRIEADQDYYLTPQALVVYYQLYELVPYAWGFPEFAVPLEALAPYTDPGGPLATVAASKVEW